MCQFVEVGTADELGAHLGQKAFALVGVFFVEEFGHHGTQHRVAEVFEALVVDAPALSHFKGFGAVDESNLVEFGVARGEAQHVFEK